jgi:hypothetical protein
MNNEKPFNFQTFSGVSLLILIIVIIIFDVNIIEKYKWLLIILFTIILLVFFIPSKSKSLYQYYLDIRDIVNKIKKNKKELLIGLNILNSLVRFIVL